MGRLSSRPTWISAALIVALTPSLGVRALSGRATRVDTHRAPHEGVHQTAAVTLTHPPEHRMPTIDDDVARILFLRMASQPDPVARIAYIKYMCGNAKPLADQQAKRLSDVVALYADRLKSLDHASAMGAYGMDRTGQRRAIVDEFRQEFGSALGPGGIARFDKIISDNVKSKVRVFNRP